MGKKQKSNSTDPRLAKIETAPPTESATMTSPFTWNWDYKKYVVYLLSQYREGKLYIYALLLLTSIFGLSFWVIQILKNPGEPMTLTALYRMMDNTYFNVVTRIVQHHMSEAFYIDSAGTGKLPYAVMGVLPYSIFHIFSGAWAFPLGDWFSCILRLAGFWFLLKPLARSTSERAFMTFAIYFCSSEYMLGDYASHWIFQGVWGVRIPRPWITCSYLFLSIGVLVRLPTILNEKIHSIPRLILYALPMAIFSGADPHFFISVALTYLLFCFYWIATRRIELSATIYFAVILGLTILPFYLQFTGLSPDTQARVGNFLVTDHLATIELPKRDHILFFILSGLACAFFYNRLEEERPALKLLIIVTSILGFTFAASPVLSALKGSNIGEHNYAYRRDQISALLFCLWVIYLISLISQYWLKSKAHHLVYILFGLIGFGVCMQKYMDFANKQALNRAEPDRNFMRLSQPQWRESARNLLKFLEQKYGDHKIVVGTLDGQLMLLLTMQSNYYLYVNAAYQTNASDEEVEQRFYDMAALLDIGDSYMEQFLASNDAQNYMSYIKYQFNRITTHSPLGYYPPQALNQLGKLRDAGYFFVPPHVAKDFYSKYLQTKSRMQVSPKTFTKYRPPDVIILNRQQPYEGITPRGYQIINEDVTFRVFARSEG